MACSFLLATALSPTTGAAAAKTSGLHQWVSGWEPFEGVALNNCNGEDVSTSGQVREDIRETVGPTGAHHLVVINRVRTTGVGLTTGAEYRSNEGGTTTMNSTGGGAQTFGVSFSGQLHSLDKSVPDLHYKIFCGQLSMP